MIALRLTLYDSATDSDLALIVYPFEADPDEPSSIALNVQSAIEELQDIDPIQVGYKALKRYQSMVGCDFGVMVKADIVARFHSFDAALKYGEFAYPGQFAIVNMRSSNSV